jgi:hypothetical protein
MSTAAQETAAQWSKRLRREQPANVFFIDPELIGPLQRAAAAQGIMTPKLIKQILRFWLRHEAPAQ